MGAIRTSVKIDGAKELEAALKELGKPSTIRRVLRPAITSAARVVRRRAKAKVPVRHGHLKKSIIAKTKTYRSGNVAGIVGPRSDTVITRKSELTGKIERIIPAKYADLVEKGHVVKFRKNGPVIGHAPAHPFMKPALEESRGEIGQVLKTRVRDGLAKEAARAAARRKR